MVVPQGPGGGGSRRVGGPRGEENRRGEEKSGVTKQRDEIVRRSDELVRTNSIPTPPYTPVVIP